MPKLKVFYADRKLDIRNAIIRHAERRNKPAYSDLGAELGIPARGPWKGVLDEIADDEIAAKRPDITYIVVSKKTGFPSSAKFPVSKPVSAGERADFDRKVKEVWDRYHPGR